MVQSNIVVEGDPPVARMPVEAAPEALYHCATPEQAAWAAEQLGPQPVAPFTQPLEVGDDRAAFDALPRAYVTCLQDRAIRPPLQRLMYTRAGCDPVIEIDTDHSPWLSRTSEIAAALDRIAGALTLDATATRDSESKSEPPRAFFDSESVTSARTAKDSCARWLAAPLGRR